MATKRDTSNYLKGCNLILELGIVIMGLGLYSYFNSAWMTKAGSAPSFCDTSGTTVFGHDICSTHSDLFRRAGKDCPSITLERYFVSIIIITFVFSLVGIWYRYPSLVAVYYCAASWLLLIAGVVYIVSAVQIDDILKWVECRGDTMDKRNNVNNDGIYYLKSEKIAAGIFTIIQALLYAVVAYIRSNEVNGNAESQVSSPPPQVSTETA